MKKSRIIALSGISCALALICVVCSIYVEFMTLTFAVLSAIFVSLPFTKNSWAGGILAYITCSICAFFIGSINSLPFILFFGAYAILQWTIEYKLAPVLKNKVLKYTLCYLLKLAYLEIVVAILWFFANAVIPTIIIFGKKIEMTYMIFALGSIPLFLLYDLMMHLLFKNLKILINRIVKDASTTTTEEEFVEDENKQNDDNNDCESNIENFENTQTQTEQETKNKKKKDKKQNK